MLLVNISMHAIILTFYLHRYPIFTTSFSFHHIFTSMHAIILTFYLHISTFFTASFSFHHIFLPSSPHLCSIVFFTDIISTCHQCSRNTSPLSGQVSVTDLLLSYAQCAAPQSQGRLLPHCCALTVPTALPQGSASSLRRSDHS
jgi:hypothetical protein